MQQISNYLDMVGASRDLLSGAEAINQSDIEAALQSALLKRHHVRGDKGSSSDARRRVNRSMSRRASLYKYKSILKQHQVKV
uniref:Uncharacterized protein n=1 Tax=Romanomermis culicivorax TaxID=13658 RepID=A0A915I3C6_ROMCU